VFARLQVSSIGIIFRRTTPLTSPLQVFHVHRRSPNPLPVPHVSGLGVRVDDAFLSNDDIAAIKQSVTFHAGSIAVLMEFDIAIGREVIGVSAERWKGVSVMELISRVAARHDYTSPAQPSSHSSMHRSQAFS